MRNGDGDRRRWKKRRFVRRIERASGGLLFIFCVRCEGRREDRCFGKSNERRRAVTSATAGSKEKQEEKELPQLLSRVV